MGRISPLPLVNHSLVLERRRPLVISRLTFPRCRNLPAIDQVGAGIRLNPLALAVLHLIWSLPSRSLIRWQIACS